ncbi:DEAD/DEAH box helicase [Alkalibaculum sp. M08DMB]|uniref:DEAD/DEAH box helicase n=1 Tax=Alkalibaculum sporogenes TaxID=2655001 RepID=A0A6A7K519_9FIRM|nr:DEAD/DEAH box helicase [Alkalibaculum sporogenes]MPW24475.1 DEAD/DEAH box helicase [Alkalibaculum sporogenes]
MSEVNFKDLGISNDILKALEKLEYFVPLEVQKQVIPFILKNKDLIVKSQTGSGKTAAFAIPLCEKIEIEHKKPQALILAPTRELALQIKEDVSHIGRFKKVRATALYGRHPIDMQKRDLKQRVHVIVGTPGRTMDHIERGNLDINEIKYLIIDEADEMLNMGFIDQVEGIIKKLPDDRVTLLFSATMPERIEEICNAYMINSKRIEVKANIDTTQKIQQIYYSVEEDDKFSTVMKIITRDKPGSCIMFCNTRDKTEYLSKLMNEKRFSCATLHGGMTQRERIQTIHGFKRGEIHFLIATDVAARGIHVEDITHVINYEVPLERENYVHRIGRTGRVSSKGIAITLVSHREQRRLDEIESYLEFEIPRGDLSDLGDDLFEDKKMPKERTRLKLKISKTSEINREITRIRINAGKKKKLRPSDVMGALTNIEGISADNIGIIDIQETCTYVEIFGGQGKKVLKDLKETTIKGRKFTTKEIHNRN